MIAISIPPSPGWDGLHPLVVHFPIGLLLVTPLLVAVAALWPKRASWAGPAALVLLALGTASAVIAKESGEAAAGLAERSEQIDTVLERHEDLAEATVIWFAALTAGYGLILGTQWLWPRLRRPLVRWPIHGVFLGLLLAACLLLANVGHQGGLLVHRLGVRAVMTGG